MKYSAGLVVVVRIFKLSNMERLGLNYITAFPIFPEILWFEDDVNTL